ncbi:MAG: ferritin-like domain-containing protein [Polyangiaceae bacterium]
MVHPLAHRILAAIAAVSATTVVACGASSTKSGGGDDGPWADKLQSNDRETQMSRQCWTKAQLAPSAPDPKTETCPEIAKLYDLGLAHRSQPTDPAGGAIVEGPTEWKGDCCYLETHWHTGRPFPVAGEVRRAPLVASASGCDAASAALAWAEDGRSEHASVASFARFALELLELGAPLELVADAHRAALDEVGHAQACFEIATSLGAGPLRPGPLAIGAASPGTELNLVRAVRAAFEEGCVAETTAVLLAEAPLERARDPRVIAALERITEEEAAHATLAFRFVAWAVATGGAPVRAAIRDTLALARLSLDTKTLQNTDDRADVELGRLTAEDVSRVRREAFDRVLEPTTRALLDVGV